MKHLNQKPSHGTLAGGIIFLFIGICSLSISTLGAVILIIISLFLFPTTKRLLSSKINTENYKVLSIISFFTIISIIGGYQTDVEEEEEAKNRQINIEYFTQNKEQILAQANKQLLERDYQAVITGTLKYLPTKDAALMALYDKASEEIAEEKKAVKAETILAELKTIPVSEYKKNKDLYNQLVSLYPRNKRYESKLEFYTTKIEEVKLKNNKIADRRRKIERQFSQWDGSHKILERLIKSTMKDPNSYEHDKTTYADKGNHLIVKTVYRGKNSFGGVVVNYITAKVSLDGKILQIIDQT